MLANSPTGEEATILPSSLPGNPEGVPGVEFNDLCYVYNVSTHSISGPATQNVCTASVTIHSHPTTTGDDNFSLLEVGQSEELC